MKTVAAYLIGTLTGFIGFGLLWHRATRRYLLHTHPRYLSLRELYALQALLVSGDSSSKTDRPRVDAELINRSELRMNSLGLS